MNCFRRTSEPDGANLCPGAKTACGPSGMFSATHFGGAKTLSFVEDRHERRYLTSESVCKSEYRFDIRNT
jgi:hypothetical protein